MREGYSACWPEWRPRSAIGGTCWLRRGQSRRSTFQLNAESTALSFTLTVAKIEDVTASHIHCASAAENGPIGVTLSGGAPGPQNGTLAEGIITAPDPGNGCGWADFAAMIGAMRSGNTYVNVHTAANAPGEIRGQIR